MSEPPRSELDTAAREAQLARVPFFEGLSREALSLIAQVTSVVQYKTSERIFSFGDPGDRLFVLVRGKVRISREISGMGEEALAVLGPGDVFGEMALLDDASRSADAVAHEACEALIISKDDFDDLLFFHKDLAYEVLWQSTRMLSARLRETNDKLTFLTVSGKFS